MKRTWLQPEQAHLTVYTWGSRSKTPRPLADVRIDVSEYRNPQTASRLKGLRPDDERVIKFVAEDDRVALLCDGILLYLEDKWSTVDNNGNLEPISVLIEDHHGTMLAPAIGEIIADMSEEWFEDSELIHVCHKNWEE